MEISISIEGIIIVFLVAFIIGLLIGVSMRNQVVRIDR